MRSFAKHLEISPSALSAMISGKRSITKKTIRRLGLKIGLSAKRIEQLASETDFKIDFKLKNKSYFHDLQTHQMDLLLNWYNLAILELMKVEGFVSSEKYVAEKLGLSVFQAREAIQTLINAGILAVQNDKSWKDLSKGYTASIPEKETSDLKRNLQKQFFSKALESIDEDTIDNRDHTGMTMAIAKEDVQMAKNIIKKFRREMSKLLENKSKKIPSIIYL